jgi:ankyrin repeat protein
MFAAWYNPNPEIVSALLKAGANPEAKDHFGETALLLAARYNKRSEGIIVLLKAGASAKVKDNLGKTAFDYVQTNEWLKGGDAYRLLQKALR